MAKLLARLVVFLSLVAHCVDPCMADAPLIWGPLNSAQLLNSGNLVAANGNIYVPSDNAVTASTAIIADTMGYLTSSVTTSTELSYVHGVTSAIQTQLAAKAANGANSDITSLSGLTTPLSVGQGGTGATTYAANDVLLGNGTSAFQVVAPGTSGHVLTSNGTTWQSSAPATSGTVTSVAFTGAGGIFSVSGSPITTSGTIAESVAGTSGGIPYFSSASALSSSGALTASQLVLGGGAGSAPTSLAAGSQYNVLTMGASTPGYGQVNLAQSAAVTGLLPVANGGTGLGTLTANNVILGAGTSTPTFVAPGTSGNALLSNGTTWASTAITQGLTVSYQSANFTAAAGNNYLVNATSGGITAALPAGSAGATILFTDDASIFGTNNLTITPNGSQAIQGITAGSSLVVNLSGGWVQLSWDATNSYWTVNTNGFLYDAVASATQQGIVSTTTQTFAGAKTFNSQITAVSGIAGNTSGGTVGTNNIGYELASYASSGTSISGTVSNLTSLALTSGTWDISGQAYATSSSSFQGLNLGIGTNSASFSGLTNGKNFIVAGAGPAPTYYGAATINPFRVYVPSSATYYLVIETESNTATAYGGIRAVLVGN